LVSHGERVILFRGRPSRLPCRVLLSSSFIILAWMCVRGFSPDAYIFHLHSFPRPLRMRITECLSLGIVVCSSFSLDLASVSLGRMRRRHFHVFRYPFARMRSTCGACPCPGGLRHFDAFGERRLRSDATLPADDAVGFAVDRRCRHRAGFRECRSSSAAACAR